MLEKSSTSFSSAFSLPSQSSAAIPGSGRRLWRRFGLMWETRGIPERAGLGNLSYAVVAPARCAQPAKDILSVAATDHLFGLRSLLVPRSDSSALSVSHTGGTDFALATSSLLAIGSSGDDRSAGTVDVSDGQRHRRRSSGHGRFTRVASAELLESKAWSKEHRGHRLPA